MSWLPEDDCGPERLAFEAGVDSYADLVDLREFQAEMDAVEGGYDIEAIIALRNLDEVRKVLPSAERALAVGDVDGFVRYRAALAYAQATADAWCRLAGFP